MAVSQMQLHKIELQTPNLSVCFTLCQWPERSIDKSRILTLLGDYFMEEPNALLLIDMVRSSSYDILEFQIKAR